MLPGAQEIDLNRINPACYQLGLLLEVQRNRSRLGMKN
jgi:hypothetical protein